MSSRKRSAAATAQVTPESAESFRQQLLAARRSAARSSSALAALCAAPDPLPWRLRQAAAEAIDDASRLQGLASIVSRIP